MKRYIVFGGEGYYAAGGFYDYLDSFDSFYKAEDFVLEIMESNERINHRLINWYQIFDIELKQMVAFEGEPHGADSFILTNNPDFKGPSN